MAEIGKGQAGLEAQIAELRAEIAGAESTMHGAPPFDDSSVDSLRSKLILSRKNSDSKGADAKTVQCWFNSALQPAFLGG